MCVTFTPTYAQKSEVSKSIVKKQETPKIKRYICCYEEKIHDENGNVVDHDSFKEWCEAFNLGNYIPDGTKICF